MLSFKAQDGRQLPILHPQDAANSLRQSLTLDGKHPNIGLARALTNHLQGCYAVKFAPVPKPDVQVAGPVLTLTVPSTLPAEEAAREIVTWAGARYVLGSFAGAVPQDTEFVASWCRQFARWFLK